MPRRWHGRWRPRSSGANRSRLGRGLGKGNTGVQAPVAAVPDVDAPVARRFVVLERPDYADPATTGSGRRSSMGRSGKSRRRKPAE